MNKSELVDAIASEAKLTKADAGRALDGFINATSKALKKGDRVALVGFGTFSVAKRNARTGRNPQTGEEMLIPQAIIPFFKASATLKKNLNGHFQKEKYYEKFKPNREEQNFQKNMPITFRSWL